MINNLVFMSIYSESGAHSEKVSTSEMSGESASYEKVFCQILLGANLLVQIAFAQILA
jgi:hypothetical protein